MSGQKKQAEKEVPMGELVEEKKEEKANIPEEEAKLVPPKVEKPSAPVVQAVEKEAPIPKSNSKTIPKAKQQAKSDLSSPMVRQESFVQLKESVYQEVGMHYTGEEKIAVLYNE